jgi:methionyl-tRNA formyltransferase
LTREYLQKNSIDLVVVFGYGKIISKDVFRCVTVLNMHPGYLPYNRGPNPNLWAILNGTPRGTTIHFMDKGVDTGDIIAQRIIPVPADNSATLQSSFNQIIDESASFFEEIWPQFRCGRTSRIPQSTGGTSHRLSDQEPILELMGDEGLNLPLAEFCSRAKTLLNEAHHRDTSPALAKQ